MTHIFIWQSVEGIVKGSQNKLSENYNKILLTAVKRWLVGQPTSIKLRGDITEVAVITNALKCCREFQSELSSPTASLNSVMSRLRDKQKACSLFEKKFGIKWPV